MEQVPCRFQHVGCVYQRLVPSLTALETADPQQRVLLHKARTNGLARVRTHSLQECKYRQGGVALSAFKKEKDGTAVASFNTPTDVALQYMLY